MSISEATRSLVVDRSAPGVFTKTGFGAVSAPAVRREAEVLTSMRHPRVPAVIDVIDDGDRVRLDVVDAGRFDLSHRVMGDASTAVRIAAGLLSAVVEIHELGWAHGSLAAQHVVVGSKFNVTLCSWSRAIDLAATPGEARDRAERADFVAVIDIVDAVIDEGAELS
ncbi:MAG: protein kinase family protein, partial [Actinobacteria bacterium]|nr:protein kinase family protein [Actinomycetota bacterium]